MGLSSASRKALAIADNKLGDMSMFGIDILTATLGELEGLDFNVELTGFDTAEIDLMLDPSVGGGADKWKVAWTYKRKSVELGLPAQLIAGTKQSRR